MIKSVVQCKCPRCREGDLFCDNNPYHFSSLFLMPVHCPSCGLKYDREPGFFYGAMYVGYALSIAYLTSVYVAMWVLLGDFEIWLYFVLGIGSLLLLTPVVFRLSRSIWISFFVKYKPDAIEKWSKVPESEKGDNPCIEV